jgi:hypothetical protein
MMSIEQARSRVEAIRFVAHDDERAHSMEDELRRDVLKQLADEGSVLAAVALMTDGIDFARHCA